VRLQGLQPASWVWGGPRRENQLHWEGVGGHRWLRDTLTPSQQGVHVYPSGGTNGPHAEVVDYHSKHMGSRHEVCVKDHHVARFLDGPQEGKNDSVTHPFVYE
jgi:hypothetical protein